MLGVYLSSHQRNIYVNTNSKGNQSWNENKEKNLLSTFLLASEIDFEKSCFLCRFKIPYQQFLCFLSFMNIFRNRSSQMFFKISALKNFVIFCSKESCQRRCFPVNIAKSSQTAVSQKLFLKKCPCNDVLITFSSQHVLGRHIVWYIKGPACLFTNLSSISRFSKKLHQGKLYKAEKWHVLSHEKYFSTHHFLDICQRTFK